MIHHGIEKMPPQITRLVLLTILIVVVYSVFRFLLTPESFGQYGWYRGHALPEIASREPVYSGQKSCDECHSDVIALVAKAPHSTISCEACHGVCREHAGNPDLKTAKLNDSLCLRCHEYVVGCPAWHKQIVLKNHYTGQGACKECHIPHQPNEVP